MIDVSSLLLFFWGAWLLVGLAVTRLSVRLEWDPEFDPSDTARQTLTVIGFLRRWLILPAAAILLPMGALNLGSGGATGADGFLLGAIVLLLPYAAIELYLGDRQAGWERAFAGDSNSDHRRAARASHGRRLLFPLILLALVLGDHTIQWNYGMIFLAGILFTVWQFDNDTHTRSFSLGRATLIEFPDLPLKSEVMWLLAKVFSPEVALYGAQESRVSDPFHYPVMHDNGSRMWRLKRRLVIPLVTLRALDPPVYTALLARELSFSRILGTEKFQSSSTPVALGIASLALFAVSVVMSHLIIPNIVDAPWAIWTTAAGLFLIGFYFVWQWLEVSHVWRENYREAFLNWHDADLAADRTIEQFVASLAQGDAILECIRSPDVAMHRLQSDSGLMRFLKLCGPEVEQAALEAARNAVDDSAATLPDA